jgi:hypothetical protein
MMDPVATAARAVAEHLATDYGPRLAAEVEVALYNRHTARKPDQYIDPVSLGTLIVAIATLAWTIYSDLRRKSSRPTSEEVSRRVLNEFRKEGASRLDTERVAEIVVTEIFLVTRDPD